MPKTIPSTRPATRRTKTSPGSSMCKSNLFNPIMALIRTEPTSTSSKLPSETSSSPRQPRYDCTRTEGNQLGILCCRFTAGTLEGNRRTSDLWGTYWRIFFTLEEFQVWLASLVSDEFINTLFHVLIHSFGHFLKLVLTTHTHTNPNFKST